MAKSSIGQFIAALRKAKGMTQQEVADRLNVSNKAVSRWERDECAPDLSAIPALAEIFGVTCDELLKGERIPESAPTERKEPRVEKQVKNLVTRTLSGFKTLIWICLAVAVVGLVCMFGISYGFYRPVIGFAVMLLFEACALVIAILAVSRTRDVKTDNELFEMADSTLVARFNNTLGGLSFAAFFVIFAVVILSLPLVLVGSGFVNSVLIPLDYFRVFFGGIVLILVFVCLKCKGPYEAWVTGTQAAPNAIDPAAKAKKAMTTVQLGLTLVAGLIFLFAPYLEFKPTDSFTLFDAAIVLALLCIVASIVCFAVRVIQNKESRKEFVLPGIRNLLTVLPLPLLRHAHYVSWGYVGEDAFVGSSGTNLIKYERYDRWHPEFIWLTLGLIAAVFLFFTIIDMLIKRKAK